MPFTLTMPKLSPTMEEGVIIKWHKKIGDAVKVDELLFEVATDKATVEYNAIDDGFLRNILVKENEKALVNQAIAIFTETKNESIHDYNPKELKIEKLDLEESKVEETVKREGVKETFVSKSIGINQPNFQLELPITDYSFEFNTSLKGNLSASPLAKKLARDKGLDITSIKGSGPRGRIMSCDLNLAQSDAIVTFGNRSIPKEVPGTYMQQPISPIRQAIGKKLQASKSFIPHFYIQQDIDVEPIISSREQLKVHGVKLTFNDFIMRAVALALKHHPVINSGFHTVNNTIVRFKTIDIAVAVSIDDGLITPIVRHVDYKNLGQISSEVKMLSRKAKEGTLKPQEYRGGSFTVSNLGMFGIHEFQAIINPPQVSILAIGGIRDTAVVKDGHVIPGKRMMITLSSDHRVVDGADGAKFIKTFQKLIENPAILLI